MTQTSETVSANVRLSFADLILLHARVRPEKPAIVLADRIATYEMLAQGILRVEDRIKSLHLPAGALVGIAIDNPIRHLIVAAALFRLGYPSLSVLRIADLLPLALPIHIFLHAESEELHLGQRQIFVGDDWFTGEQRRIPTDYSTGFTNNWSICRIELSSGTTGRPKAVSLSVEALHNRLINYYSSIGLGVWDRLLPLPGLTSSWGFSLAAHALFAGRTLAFSATLRDALHMVAIYSIDAVVASTYQLRELVREQTRAPIPCPSLRVLVVGGSLLPRSLMMEAGARLCSSIASTYGSAEAGQIASGPVDRLNGIDGAVGYVAPWAEVEIVNDNDNLLPADSEGNVRIRATGQGEPFPPERPDAHAGFRGGWIYPGDRGRVTSDGLFVLSGRMNDVINVGGIKVAPATIEALVQQHPAVVEAAAVGSIGADGLEQIVVVIIARPPISAQAVIDWCAERGIVIARVIVVDKLPKTESGKIHYNLIRQLHVN